MLRPLPGQDLEKKPSGRDDQQRDARNRHSQANDDQYEYEQRSNPDISRGSSVVTDHGSMVTKRVAATAPGFATRTRAASGIHPGRCVKEEILLESLTRCRSMGVSAYRCREWQTRSKGLLAHGQKDHGDGDYEHGQHNEPHPTCTKRCGRVERCRTRVGRFCGSRP